MWWDQTGYALQYKRLHRATTQAPRATDALAAEEDRPGASPSPHAPGHSSGPISGDDETPSPRGSPS
ncbi:hypothetical protein [Nannocystis radixulma]|uniref:hypothetical protein n=1 Tax=Nannocystis radixulma TaxID=2995305 RepID=UPI00358DCC5E